MLEFTHLQPSDLDTARTLAYENYLEAQSHAPELPTDGDIPELNAFIEGGVAWGAWQGGTLVGYLGFYKPFEGLFGPVLGTFSPLHGHAAVAENRSYIHSRLYEAAANELVDRGATSHAVVLHASDTSGIHSFFTNGFGLRTVDAMRLVERIPAAAPVDLGALTLEELDPAEFALLLPLHQALATHMTGSPSFMPLEIYTEERLLETFTRRASRHFVARDGKRIVAYMELTPHGENFMTVSPTTRNICGAYMLPAYRGRGLYTALLDYLLATLQGEGFTHLGVDFEGFNPTARGFWLKHFTATTNGVTRRIDERILGPKP